MAGSMVTLLAAWRVVPRLGHALLPVVMAIAAATIYGRYHYVVDVVAGVAVGTMGVIVAWRRLEGQYHRREVTLSRQCQRAMIPAEGGSMRALIALSVVLYTALPAARRIPSTNMPRPRNSAGCISQRPAPRA